MSSLSASLIAGRYRLKSQVGTGNMSTVYEAEDTRRGHRVVAVKLLDTRHDDALKREIFRRETRALTQLEHPNIVTVLDYGWSEERRSHYLVFDYLPHTLLDVIQTHERSLDDDWCWLLMREMADALAHAHSQGVIHRDVKPSNVLISADGHAQLGDFGVSYLKYELGTGLTVSSFWPAGYASPEQRSGQAVTEQSDMFSLGCVFYHMLSRNAPLPDGITGSHITALGRIPQSMRNLLARLLAPNPTERFEQMTQICRLLEQTRQFELLPEVYLLVTETARRDLFNLGHIARTSMEAACAFLLQELGGDNPKDVSLSLDQDGTLRLLTETLRLVCVRDPVAPVLVVKAIHVPYLPQMERQKNQATPARYLWQVIAQLGADSPPATLRLSLGQTLDALFDRVATRQVEVRTARKRAVERRDFTRLWHSVLMHQQKQLNAIPRLSYTYVGRQGSDSLSFTLSEPPPDTLPWPDNAPIAVLDAEKPQSATFVGHLSRIDGLTVRVIRDAADMQAPIQPAEDLPSAGVLGVFQQEAQASLTRQQDALDIVRAGATVNPHLPAVLLDLSAAEFEEVDPGIVFFQRDLAADKQQAVRQALAARDIFLLQGPPGTGKTTTLAEIILQILKIKPDARILVASQSNVAVNHILWRVAELQAGTSVEIVRIGRAEKIGHGAQVWTIDQRLSDWRNEVLARTEQVLTTLQQRVRATRRAQQGRQHLPERVRDDLLLCQQWLEELDDDEEELAATLELIRETLPGEVRGEALAELAAERERLGQLVAHLLAPDPSQSREEQLITLVKNWRKMFGKRKDFARPILERASILAATCLISGGYYLKEQEFDWAIIDEAGRATAPELLVPLVRARRAILVGDERQLPPMLDEELSERELVHLGTSREELGESLFASLLAQGKEEGLPAVQMLTAQHRMHPAIGQLVSEVFYEGKLTHAVNAHERAHGLPWLARPVTWFSTARLPKHYETHQGQSYYNRAEILGITQLLHRMERSYREQGEHKEVAVITPYNAQIVELQAEITPASPFWQALSIEIATIDAFQGRDRDLVLYSPVRSNKEGRLGFLRDRRRLNVALSRARQALIIVGDHLTLERGRGGPEGNPYLELLRYLRTHPQECQLIDLPQEAAHG
jgi:serine/threonine-protein kinase